MTSAVAIMNSADHAMKRQPGVFKTPQEWAEELNLQDVPIGRMRLCLEHLADRGRASRKLSMTPCNIPVVRYGRP